MSRMRVKHRCGSKRPRCEGMMSWLNFPCNGVCWSVRSRHVKVREGERVDSGINEA